MVNCTYSDLWKSYLYFRPAVSYCTVFMNVDFDNYLTPMKYASFFFYCKEWRFLLREVFGGNLGTGDYGHITTEHASMLFRNHLSLREYSNQGFEAAHSLQCQLYYIQKLLPMTDMVMLHQVSFIFSFFSIFFYILYHTQHYST